MHVTRPSIDAVRSSTRPRLGHMAAAFSGEGGLRSSWLSRIGSRNMQPMKIQPAKNDWAKTARCEEKITLASSAMGCSLRRVPQAWTKRCASRRGWSAAGRAGRSSRSSTPLRSAALSVGVTHQNVARERRLARSSGDRSGGPERRQRRHSRNRRSRAAEAASTKTSHLPSSSSFSHGQADGTPERSTSTPPVPRAAIAATPSTASTSRYQRRARRGRGATSSGACMVCARLPLTRFARATGVGLCRYGYDLRVYLHPCNRRGVAVSVAGVVSVSRVSNRLHLIRTSGEPCATEAPHPERAAVQSRTTSHSNVVTSELKGLSPSSNRDYNRDHNLVVNELLMSPNRAPTESQPSPNRAPTESQPSPNRAPTESQPSPNRVPTEYQPSPNRVPTESTRSTCNGCLTGHTYSGRVAGV
jgi:hypothetical protein